jgi:hypothetical protein
MTTPTWRMMLSTRRQLNSTTATTTTRKMETMTTATTTMTMTMMTVSFTARLRQQRREERDKVKADDVKEEKVKGDNQTQQKSRHNSNTSINHDFVICGEGDVDIEGDTDGKDSDNNVDLFKEKRYEKANWTKHKTDDQGG